MSQPSRKLPERPGRDHGRIAWVVLAVVLICLPLAAIAKMIITNDDELDDVVAQSLIEFTTQDRLVYGGGGQLNYDAVIMKVHGTIMVQSIYMNQVKLGYWNGGGVWDVELDGHSAGHDNNGVIWGGNGCPVYLRGLRVELGYDNINAANPNFLFLRIGSDDFSGCLDLNPNNYGELQSACIDRISMDGKVKSNQSILIIAPAVTLNGNFARITEADTGILGTYVPTNNMQNLYYHCGPYDTGRTDFYISLASTINASNGSGTITGSNGLAWNPGYTFNSTRSIAEHIPGRGFWMHFQALYAEATMW